MAIPAIPMTTGRSTTSEGLRRARSALGWWPPRGLGGESARPAALCPTPPPGWIRSWRSGGCWWSWLAVVRCRRQGGVAAALVACREAAKLGLAGDVAVAAVADEEQASLGVQEVLRTIGADAAVVTEPTELQVTTAHKGFVWSEIEVVGRADHGSRPHLGIDAIVKAGPVLTALGELDRALAQRVHSQLGRPSVHASLIKGGGEMSSYSGSCRIGLERRTVPGESAGDVEEELTALLARCQSMDPALEASHRTLLVREPFQVGAGSEIVSAVRDAAAEVLGKPPELTYGSYWADSAFIAGAGVPTVLFGPSGEGAHATEEWVSLSSCEAVARSLVELAKRLCA